MVKHPAAAKAALARLDFNRPYDGHWVTPTELAYHLGVSHRAVTNWTAAKLIPCYRLEGLLRYDLVAVRKALERFIVPEAPLK